MKPINVVLWGRATEYDCYRKNFEVEVLRGNLNILAIVFNETSFCSQIDGIPVIPIEGLLGLEYDYLIDMNQIKYPEVEQILRLLRVPQEKVIPARVFALTCFDLERWQKVKESNISIISSHCWGGFAYHSLGLPFRSPFINMFMANDDFLELVSDLKKYMEMPLVYHSDGYEENLKRNYPIAALGELKLHFNHYESFEAAVECWESRKQRINYDNIFIEMYATKPEQLERFLQLPYEHKICFTMLPCEEKGVISLQGDYYTQQYPDATSVWRFANRTVSRGFDECRTYDLLKLLNHEEDYMRVK